MFQKFQNKKKLYRNHAFFFLFSLTIDMLVEIKRKSLIYNSLYLREEKALIRYRQKFLWEREITGFKGRENLGQFLRLLFNSLSFTHLATFRISVFLFSVFVSYIRTVWSKYSNRKV